MKKWSVEISKPKMHIFFDCEISPLHFVSVEKTVKFNQPKGCHLGQVSLLTRGDLCGSMPATRKVALSAELGSSHPNDCGR